MMFTRRHRRTRSRSRRRSNPMRSRSRRRGRPAQGYIMGAGKIRRRKLNPRRRTSSRRRRNPSFVGTLRSGFDRTFIMNALLTSGGLILGTKTASFVQMIPFMDKVGRFSGLVNIILGGVFAGLIKNPHAKSLFVGFAAGGAYNLIATNVSALQLEAISGDELLGLEMNGQAPLVQMNGIEVSGQQALVPVMGGANWAGNSYGGGW